MTALRDAFTLLGGQVLRRGGVQLSDHDRRTRRRIRRALARGAALERPEEARTAVWIARRRLITLRQLRPWMYAVLALIVGLSAFYGVRDLFDRDVLRGLVRVGFAVWFGWLTLGGERARRVLPRAEARNLAILTSAGLPAAVESGTIVEPSAGRLAFAAVTGLAFYAVTYGLLLSWLADDGAVTVGGVLLEGLPFGVLMTAAMLTVAVSRTRRACAETSALEPR